MSEPTYIQVWRFRDAPKELQTLSTSGGDEDWVALIPPHLAGQWIGWMEPGTSFGRCDVTAFPHPSLPGYAVRIGSHV